MIIPAKKVWVQQWCKHLIVACDFDRDHVLVALDPHQQRCSLITGRRAKFEGSFDFSLPPRYTFFVF
jgi:hypothetical protein